MVLRNKRISNKADVVQIHVSFGVPDVKQWLMMYAQLLMCVDDAKSRTHNEQDVRLWLENDGRAFLSWPKQWRGMLSSWAWAVALREKFVISSATNENQFYLSDCLFSKRGRPKKAD